MGKIELDHTGSGGGVTLSSDGTDLLLDGTAIGGGGTALELYAENPSNPTANTVTGTNSAAIGSNLTVSGNASFAVGLGATATGYSSFAFGDGSDATNSYAIAMGGNSATASGAQSVAIGYGVDATGADSIALGRNSQARASSANAFGRDSYAIGLRATAIGDSYASGADSFAAAIANNTSSYGATGNNSVAMGDRCKASASRSVSVGRLNNVTGPNGAVALGQSNIVSGEAAFSSGQGNVASGSYSVALGNLANTQSIYGKVAVANGGFGISGSSQSGMFTLREATTDAVAGVLTANGGAPSTTNQIILPNNSAYAFHGTIVARQQASQGTACAAWKVEGLIRREGSAGTTVLVNSATTVLDNTPAWGMALSADTTNGGLAITVTGAAATNIRFVATISTSEVTY